MLNFAGRDEVGYDEAEELIADLEALVRCGLVTAVRVVGGETRYGLAARDGDNRDGEPDALPGDVFHDG
jgi:hypothetical protein